jgi:hypothetical protein
MDLSTDQSCVASASASDRQLVLAGAGTGKTHTLIARLNHLIRDEGISSGSGILVLSFTRAAVREIRDRTKESGGDVAYVRARTFDSFATQLLRQIDDEASWRPLGYDDRIRRATELDLLEPLESFRHIVVDEIQDLVGVRADFVKTVLQSANAGFTLFGDIAQSIYDYQVKQDGTGDNFPRFLRWLKNQYGSALQVRTFAENFRAQTRITKAVWEVWPRLCVDTPDYAAIRQDLDELLRSEDSISDLHTLSRYARDADSKTAVLCRTNGGALVVSRDLNQIGIAHTLQRQSIDRAVHPWVARTLNQQDHTSIGFSHFSDLYSQTEEVGMPNVHDAWLSMRSVAKEGKNQVNLGRLISGLRVGFVPNEMVFLPETPLTISTVHRSKGREFSRVVLLDDVLDDVESDDLAEETRVLFVAASRPRQDLFVMERPPDVRWVRYDKRSGRWIRRGWKVWQTFGFEFQVTDLDRESPAGATVKGVDPILIQHYIQSEVAPGDELEVVLTGPRDPHDGFAEYAVRHRGNLVGVTGSGFSHTLLRRLGKGANKWPAKFHGLRVDAIETVPGTPAESENVGLGPAGLWLGVRPVGLASIEWS